MTSPYQWTPEADEMMRRVYRREISVAAACAELGVTANMIYYRAQRLNLSLSRAPRTETPQPLPDPRDGWIPIAHKADRHWRPIDGAPITIEAARAAVYAGRATMAHRRVDGGFDLLFRVAA